MKKRGIVITTNDRTWLEIPLHTPPLSRVDESRASRHQEENYAGTHCEDQGAGLPVPRETVHAA